MADRVVKVDESQYLATPYKTHVPDQSGTYLDNPDGAPEYRVVKDDDEAADVRAARRGTVEERNARKAAPSKAAPKKAAK
jgi:hypothetical protein